MSQVDGILRTAVENARTKDVFTSTNRSNGPMRRMLESEGWSFSGELTGLDQGDPELVFYIQDPSDHRTSPPPAVEDVLGPLAWYSYR